ncbi:hypothetical protein E2C01_086561 [Portunus trituberculatus]|uniref:Uncharacterized protein n=1 Tax=Portunus trituberculatus TaxID=210409 RepID=A0A5B7JEX3_PORTR|nr:hypothetical protein [Portunus trituberculatus]
MWEVLFSFRPLVTQAILSIVLPISPPKLIFSVTTKNLGIMSLHHYRTGPTSLTTSFHHVLWQKTVEGTTAV